MAKRKSGSRSGKRGLRLDGELQFWAGTDVRFASADEIGDFVAVLVSDKQGGMGWMAGSDVVVDGGEFVFGRSPGLITDDPATHCFSRVNACISPLHFAHVSIIVHLPPMENKPALLPLTQ